ncbi:hypothetical protein L1987_66898 [Smallanthus sonchifolius]|uniref:Uncharacterized protein n=1 Tax=Smallanthus sonchifolius TaxID=185202 RepID=A0ACB9BYR3_9ASTR|nr:hypothetical protein L1987_66898 [Smallanthus sonchifolius]
MTNRANRLRVPDNPRLITESFTLATSVPFTSIVTYSSSSPGPAFPYAYDFFIFALLTMSFHMVMVAHKRSSIVPSQVESVQSRINGARMQRR